MVSLEDNITPKPDVSLKVFLTHLRTTRITPVVVDLAVSPSGWFAEVIGVRNEWGDLFPPGLRYPEYSETLRRFLATAYGRGVCVAAEVDAWEKQAVVEYRNRRVPRET